MSDEKISIHSVLNRQLQKLAIIYKKYCHYRNPNHIIDELRPH